MNFKLVPETPPLREEPSGAIRIGKTRVLLEIVIWEFQKGATPEMIVQNYDTLSLREVYAVIAYYLQHTTEVDEYLARREAEGEANRARAEANNPNLASLRERLRAYRQSRS